MTIEDRARSATRDLLEASQPNVTAMLDDLERSRRRGNMARVVATTSALLAVVLGAAVFQGPDDAGVPEPAAPPRPTNGALVSIHLGDPLVVSGQLTELPNEAGPADPEFTSDGQELLYQGRVRRIMAMDVTDGQERVVGECPGEANDSCGFALAPDQQRLAVVASRAGQQGLEIRDLGSGSSNFVPVPSLGWPEPAWSPDGEQLAYVGTDGLHVMAPDGTADRRILDVEQGQSGWGAPAWSPDGSRLSLMIAEEFQLPPRVGSEPGNRFNLVVVDKETGEITDLGDMGACACLGVAPPHHTWSPDGRWIAASTVEPPRSPHEWGSVTHGGVFLIRPDGSDRQRISGLEVGPLAWQPLSTEATKGR